MIQQQSFKIFQRISRKLIGGDHLKNRPKQLINVKAQNIENIEYNSKIQIIRFNLKLNRFMDTADPNYQKSLSKNFDKTLK